MVGEKLQIAPIWSFFRLEPVGGLSRRLVDQNWRRLDGCFFLLKKLHHFHQTLDIPNLVRPRPMPPRAITRHFCHMVFHDDTIVPDAVEFIQYFRRIKIAFAKKAFLKP
jgi:hypothetical protein